MQPVSMEKRKRGALAVLVALCAAVVASPRPALADMTVTDADGLLAAVQTSQTVTLGADISLSQTLDVTEGVSVTITGDHAISFTSGKGASYETAGAGKTAVNVQGSLTLAGGAALNGKELGASGVSALYNNGSVTLDGGAIQGFTLNSGNRSVVLSEGEGTTFDIKSGSIKDNVCDNNPGGIVEVSRGAKLTMSGGEISNNTAVDEADQAAAVLVGISQYVNYGAGSCDDAAGSFEFTGGAISGNKGVSTVYVGESVGALMPNYYPWGLEVTFTNHATMTMSGSAKIADNEASRFGGGVTVWGPAVFTMDGGTISGNSAPMGAGVAAVDMYSAGDLDNRVDRSNPTYGGIDVEKWSETRPAAFTMNGGTISGNTGTGSQPVGAGVYVASNEVELNAGTISDNTALTEDGEQGQGGGIYVASLPYKVVLHRAYVSDNDATVLGGGMWLCPMGGAESYVKNSGAIIGNTSDGAGADVASLAKDREGGDTGARLSLLDRLLGNYGVDWYQDGGIVKKGEDGNWTVLGLADGSVERYPDLLNKLGGAIEECKDDVALKAVSSDEAAKQAAQSQAQLFITGNKAARGGGIGANGIVQFGDAPVVYPSVDLKVTKQWDDGKAQDDHDPVTVHLLQYDSDGAGHEVATATLSADNGWTCTFTATDDGDLLSKYGAYGEDHAAVATGRQLTRYAFEEDVPEGYEASTSEFTHTITVASQDVDVSGASLESAADLAQLVNNGTGTYVETFAAVKAKGTAGSGDGAMTLTFEGLPDTQESTESGTVRADYRVQCGEKTNEDFKGLSDGGFNKLDPNALKTEDGDVVVTETLCATLTNAKQGTTPDGDHTPDSQSPNATPASPTAKKVPKTGDSQLPAALAAAACLGAALVACGAAAFRHR